MRSHIPEIYVSLSSLQADIQAKNISETSALAACAAAQAQWKSEKEALQSDVMNLLQEISEQQDTHTEALLAHSSSADSQMKAHVDLSDQAAIQERENYLIMSESVELLGVQLAEMKSQRDDSELAHAITKVSFLIMFYKVMVNILKPKNACRCKRADKITS